jgi:hypothetical protein
LEKTRETERWYVHYFREVICALFPFEKKTIEDLREVDDIRRVGIFFGGKKIAIRGTACINTHKQLKVFRPGPFVRL